VPIHVVEPVRAGSHDLLLRFGRAGQVQAFVAPRTKAHRVTDRLRLARLGVAVERRVLVRAEPEQDTPADLTKGQPAQERDRLGEKLRGFLRPRLAVAAVLVFPALVFEKVEAHVPREIHAMAVREEARLDLVERVVGLVAEAQRTQIALQERAWLVGQRTELPELVVGHRRDDVAVVDVAVGRRAGRGHPHPFQAAAGRVGRRVDETEGDLVVERAERAEIDEGLEVDERKAPDAPKGVAAHGRLPRIFQRVAEGTSYGSPKQAAVTASAVDGASRMPLRWCPVA
jgi:hypothetical protein